MKLRSVIEINLEVLFAKRKIIVSKDWVLWRNIFVLIGEVDRLLNLFVIHRLSTCLRLVSEDVRVREVSSESPLFPSALRVLETLS